MENRERKLINLIGPQYAPCSEAREWLEDKTIEEAFNTCTRADWFMWLYNHVHSLNTDERLRPYMRAKIEVALTVKHLVKHKDTLKLLKLGEDYCEGKFDRAKLFKKKEALARKMASVESYNSTADRVIWNTLSVLEGGNSRGALSALYPSEEVTPSYEATEKQYADICRKHLPLEIWELG